MQISETRNGTQHNNMINMTEKRIESEKEYNKMGIETLEQQ
jgi:hypothetical protein